mmetsp:Transcript_4786/g.9600  ORF Transcript_4786/g.9600 Transcript_4786/m.9600 type:complete len:915 (-) Transcript_4786:28-2772(-)
MLPLLSTLPSHSLRAFALLLLFPHLCSPLAPYVTDSNDVWETPNCPADMNAVFSNFRYDTNNFIFECKTNIDVSVAEPNPYQLFASSAGVPDHPTTFTVSPASHSYKIPVKKPIPREVLFQDIYDVSTLGGANVPIGFALNGVPFFSALSADNVDVVQGRPGSGSEAKPHDTCMGYVDGGQYNYKTLPPCLYTSSDGKGQQQLTPFRPYDAFNFTTAFGEYLHGDRSYNQFWMTNLVGAPFVVGIALDGYLIYSPYDANGDLHTGLDSCGGKVYGGTYAYFTTPHFPYVLGCFGPGIISDSDVNTNKTTTTTSKCSPGRYSSYSNDKLCLACPAGRFNLEGGTCANGECTGFEDETCSGLCEAGYFCPSGSSSPRQQPCGGREYYCPAGATDKQRVQAGYYSTPLESPSEFGQINSTKTVVGRKKMEASFIREAQTPCDPGYYCTGDGLRRACSEAGAYGQVSMLTNRSCTDRCPAGSYCTPSSPTPILCPAGRWGGTEGLQSSECSGLCDKGHYCEVGSTSATQAACPAGRYGANEGLTSSSCSRDCDPEGTCEPTVCARGHYCPAASTIAESVECGGPDKFCPAGSSTPTAVSAGHYTLGDFSLLGKDQSIYDENRRFDETVCEPGRYCSGGVRLKCAGGSYGSSTANTASTCDGLCSAGHFCPQGSISTTENRCGSPNVYCPQGSAAPVDVPYGYYSITGAHDTRSAIAICPRGSFCVKGVAHLCPAGTYGSVTGLTNSECSGPCKAGFYCPEGSTYDAQIACPLGTFGLGGSGTAECSGRCRSGYYCPLASTSPTMFQCGGDFNYCPLGSGIPLNVTLNHYSVGGNSTTRHSQELCNVDGFVRPSREYVVRQDGHSLNNCPSRTRTLADEGTFRKRAYHGETRGYQTIDRDYHIDPENEFKFDHEYGPNV